MLAISSKSDKRNLSSAHQIKAIKPAELVHLIVDTTAQDKVIQPMICQPKSDHGMDRCSLQGAMAAKAVFF